MFGRATIRLGIGPHSSYFSISKTVSLESSSYNFKLVNIVANWTIYVNPLFLNLAGYCGRPA